MRYSSTPPTERPGTDGGKDRVNEEHDMVIVPASAWYLFRRVFGGYEHVALNRILGLLGQVLYLYPTSAAVITTTFADFASNGATKSVMYCKYDRTRRKLASPSDVKLF